MIEFLGGPFLGLKQNFIGYYSNNKLYFLDKIAKNDHSEKQT